MRPRLVLPLFVVLASALSGCDLMSDPDGPQPEDFQVHEDTSEVRSTDDDSESQAASPVRVQHDVAAPLSTARGDIAQSISAPR